MSCREPLYFEQAPGREAARFRGVPAEGGMSARQPLLRLPSLRGA
jgi:hypothetical protein